MMARFYAAVRAPVERHGGTVEKVIGDALVAVFGIPTVHEDDALRAVRAALEMREAVRAMGEVQARIGVNTGDVLARDPTRGRVADGRRRRQRGRPAGAGGRRRARCWSARPPGRWSATLCAASGCRRSPPGASATR